MDADYSFMDYSFMNFTGTESLLTSQYAKVIFLDIKEKYSVEEDLHCQYSFTNNFFPSPGDRIVLYRLGWQDIKDYVLFEWVTSVEDKQNLFVRIKAQSLPRELEEFYQLCYISSENSVCGASVPFQFVIGMSSSSTYSSLKSENNEIVTEPSTSNSQRCVYEIDGVPKNETNTLDRNSQLDIFQLQEENKLLKQELFKTTKSIQVSNLQINDLKTEVEELKNSLKVTKDDVADLRLRMDIATAEQKQIVFQKIQLEKKFDRLLKKCQAKGKRFQENGTSDSVDDLGELEPLPPFPLQI